MNSPIKLTKSLLACLVFISATSQANQWKNVNGWCRTITEDNRFMVGLQQGVIGIEATQQGCSLGGAIPALPVIVNRIAYRFTASCSRYSGFHDRLLHTMDAEGIAITIVGSDETEIEFGNYKYLISPGNIREACPSYLPGAEPVVTPSKNEPIPRLEVTESLKEKALNAAKITLKRRYYRIDSTTIWPEPKIIVSSDNSTFRYDPVDTPSEATKMRIDIVITNAGKIVQTPSNEIFR